MYFGVNNQDYYNHTTTLLNTLILLAEKNSLLKQKEPTE